MKKFLDLLNQQCRLPPQQQAEWATAQIEKMLTERTMNTWHVDDPIPRVSQRILIGIVPWSGYDLRLLDALSQAYSGAHRPEEQLEIFDIDAAGRASGGYDYLERMIPGIGKIFQTPVVGVWEKEVLTQKATGAAGRDLIIARYGLNRDEILPP